MHELPPIFGDGGTGGDRRQPEITYPARWSYHVIGADPERLRIAVIDAVGTTEHSWEGGAESRRGRWHSLRVQVLVADERQRLEILAALQAHDAVRLVL